MLRNFVASGPPWMPYFTCITLLMRKTTSRKAAHWRSSTANRWQRPTRSRPASEAELHDRAARISARSARLDGCACARAASALVRPVAAGLRGSQGLGAHTQCGALGHGDLARSLRRPKSRSNSMADLRRGVLPGRRADPGQSKWHLLARAHHDGIRDRRAEGPVPATHGRRRRYLGAGLV